PRDDLDFDFCSGSLPLDMIIRTMSVEMNLYFDGIPKSHSTWEADCTLSNKYNFTNFPKNLPPRGVAFDCATIGTPCHGNCP
ncbi:MAG: hypothetical protein ACREYF_06495, partial [Gammaproteobacteria bacterium]